MAKPTVDSLSRKSEAINRQYADNFAGQSRHTRDLVLLEKLIDRQGKVLLKAKKLKGKPAHELREKVRERYRMYKKEHELILEAQTLGRADIELNETARRVVEVMGLYERNFAGQNRLTRPDALLPHMQAQIRRRRKVLQGLEAEDDQALAEYLATAEGNLELLAGEAQEIKRARKSLDPDGRESVYAEIANNYFRMYQVHFAAKARVSRRPEVIDIVVDGLEHVLETFEGLDGSGYSSETLGDNIATVRERLDAYRAEIGNSRAAIAELKPRERVGALGGDANDIMALYAQHFAGQDRRTRDLGLIRELADRLYFNALETEDLGEDLGGANQDQIKNLAIVQKTLQMYHEEYGKIRDIQQPGGTSSGPTGTTGLDGMLRIRPELDDP